MIIGCDKGFLSRVCCSVRFPDQAVGQIEGVGLIVQNERIERLNAAALRVLNERYFVQWYGFLVQDSIDETTLTRYTNPHMPEWRNGRRERLNLVEKSCGFDSHLLGSTIDP